MAGLSTKSDSTFFNYIIVGAIGANAVVHDLNECGHDFRELENGSVDVKLWKDVDEQGRVVKRKRVRIPDLVCIRCGQRIESRAKTSASLTMSHSPSDAERAWDYGMTDDDIIAFPVCDSIAADVWDSGNLHEGTSYYHSQDRIVWKAQDYINYFWVQEFRKVAHARSSVKGVTEGSETAITWDAIFSSRDGVVEKVVDNQKISIRRSSDGHLYTWQNRKGLQVVVSEGDTVSNGQVIACNAVPMTTSELVCTQRLSSGQLISLFKSPQRTQRFTGIKMARLRRDREHEDLIRSVATHPDEDVYVTLEGFIYLASVCGYSAQDLFKPFLESTDEEVRLETVVALSETATDEATTILSGILNDPSNAPYLRSAAAWALGKIGTEHASEALIAAFKDVDLAIREEALIALGSMGEGVIEKLATEIVADDEEIAAGAAEALRRQSRNLPQDVIEELIRKIGADKSQIWSVWLMGHLPPSEISASIADLQDKNPEAHYAISVLWAFMGSWIAKHWDPYPNTVQKV